MEVKVQTVTGEVHSLELDLDMDDNVNALVSQVSACLASVVAGNLQERSAISSFFTMSDRVVCRAIFHVQWSSMMFSDIAGNASFLFAGTYLRYYF
jgi:hypothetical protein